MYGLLELSGSKWPRDITARQMGLLGQQAGLAGGGKKLKAWNLGEVQIQEHTVESGFCLSQVHSDPTFLRTRHDVSVQFQTLTHSARLIRIVFDHQQSLHCCLECHTAPHESYGHSQMNHFQTKLYSF